MSKEVATAVEGSRIESVQARTISVPLDHPTAFSTRHVTAREYALVKIRSIDGHEGIGFCYAGSHSGSIVTQAVRQLHRDRLKAQSALQVEGLWVDMYQASLLHGRTGSVMRALSIIDIALWDRNARAQSLAGGVSRKARGEQASERRAEACPSAGPRLCILADIRRTAFQTWR